jgi:16S rRNA (guanine527-N7)-methyltransferase
MCSVPATNELQEVLNRHQLTVSDYKREQLERYCHLLWDWNAKLNLTRHTDFEAFVTRDLVDSQHLAALLPEGDRVLDVGSGGGVPGIVMAILRPDLKLTLAESTAKKAKALEDMVSKLRLRVQVAAVRAEKHLAKNRYDSVVARAVAPLKKSLPWFSPVRKSFKRLLLIKGPRWQQELQEAQEEGVARRTTIDVVDEYPSFGRDGNSVILSLKFS